MDELRREWVVARAGGAIDGDLPEETVLLRVSDGTAVRINETGAWLWKQTSDPLTVGELADRLASRHEISADRALSDVSAFLADLSERGFIELRDDPGTAG